LLGIWLGWGTGIIFIAVAFAIIIFRLDWKKSSNEIRNRIDALETKDFDIKNIKEKPAMLRGVSNMSALSQVSRKQKRERSFLVEQARGVSDITGLKKIQSHNYHNAQH